VLCPSRYRERTIQLPIPDSQNASSKGRLVLRKVPSKDCCRTAHIICGISWQRISSSRPAPTSRRVMLSKTTKDPVRHAAVPFHSAPVPRASAHNTGPLTKYGAFQSKSGKPHGNRCFLSQSLRQSATFIQQHTITNQRRWSLARPKFVAGHRFISAQEHPTRRLKGGSIVRTFILFRP